MKTLGLLVMTAVALPLSACRVQGRCEDVNDPAFCHKHDPGYPDACFYDNDCGSGYVCQNQLCVTLPIPPERGAGGYGGAGSQGTGGAGGDFGVGGRQSGIGGAIANGGTGGRQTGVGGAIGSAGTGGSPSGVGGASPIDGGAGPGCDGAGGAGGAGSCHVHPAPVCQFDSQCGTSGRCLDGECQRACTAASDCGTGQICAAGYCQTPATSGGQCLYNADCGAGKTCINGVCHPACKADSDCPTADRCVGDICQPDTGPQPQCRASADCVGLHVTEDECVDAICRTPCLSNVDCCVGSSGSVCQMGYCVTDHEVTPMCRISNDCGAGKLCVDAACE